MGVSLKKTALELSAVAASLCLPSRSLGEGWSRRSRARLIIRARRRGAVATTRPSLRVFLFRLGGFRRLVNDEGLEPGKFLFESRNEVACAVFEQDDKAKREEQEKSDPKNAA
jgi:hypothetical protein